METDYLTFAKAFDADLRTYGREQSEICALLTEEGEPVLTTAAISNWKKRDRIPYVRLARLVQIFGPDSQCARYMEWIESHELQEGPPLLRPLAGPLTLLPKGKARIRRWHQAGAPESDTTETERLHQALDTLLSIIPNERKNAALEAALRVVADHLHQPPSE